MAEIETPRLRLRPHQRSDLEALQALWSDPRALAWIAAAPATREDAWARLRRYIGHWFVFGFGYWAVLDKATGAYVGDVGAAFQHRELSPPPPDAPEAGWVIAPDQQGRGFAYEAASHGLRWLDHTHGYRRSVAIIHPQNAGSVRLADRLGFQAAGVSQGPEGSWRVFERQRGAAP